MLRLEAGIKGDAALAELSLNSLVAFIIFR